MGLDIDKCITKCILLLIPFPSLDSGEKCYSLEGHLYCRARECNAARVHQWYKLSSDCEQEPGLILIASVA